MLDRRIFLASAAAVAACGRPSASEAQPDTSAGTTASTPAPGAPSRREGAPRIVAMGEASEDFASFTREDWRARLTKAEFDVLRREGTERPGSSPLLEESRAGTYICAGCALPLFRSETKFESGTGWPSFYTHIEGALETKTDLRLWTPRTEYHCVRCEGHQGHVFEDGPEPTGERWCNNGVALDFVPDTAT